jgi:symplekin
MKETLHDSLPASDKSVSRLLGEVPFLPDAALRILEDLRYAGRFVRDRKEVLSGDRVTQGLSVVWSLILLRPPTRVTCLDIALQSAVHSIEEVWTKAIRLVANKLYPLSYLSQNIEEFATKKMLSVVDGLHTGDGMEEGLRLYNPTLRGQDRYNLIRDKQIACVIEFAQICSCGSCLLRYR